jgi:hypothetical protein
MKHLKTFESFQINEEEEIIGAIKKLGTDIKKSITGEATQEKIAKYTKEVLSGKISEDLKKDFESYKKSKPDQGLGSSMGTWLSYVTNVDDLVKSPAKPATELVDASGKNKPAAEVIEEEVAKMILKDRLVSKKDGKWGVETKGRSFGTTPHTFGGGA